MCGITGWVSFDRDLTRHRDEVEAMTATMACRGPDAGGVHLERHAGLGHRRLAIIDVEGGAQPMSARTDDGEVVLLHSGEVYGFAELREELVRRGHRFSTRSDTEVVLRGYLEWGEAVAERLDGMVALAIWDARVERLLLVRDRLGIKPLYYAETQDGVLFGSEAKALLANPLADRTVDLDGLRAVVSLAVPPGAALWRGMREVLPGGVVTVDRGGLREHRYWTLRSRPHTDDLETTVGTVRSLLEDVVAHQTVSDVPRCTLLSGGLDSSALTAMAALRLAERGEQVRSFAVDFTGGGGGDDGATPDGPFAREVAAHVGAQHQRIVLEHSAMADPSVRRAVIAARDSPMTWGDIDSSMLLLFRAIREHSTVALSGEGADEVFGGYDWFHQAEKRAQDSFPWMEMLVRGSEAQLASRFRDDLVRALDLPAYVREQHAAAVAEVEHLDGEEEEGRRRTTSYLAVTRIVRSLLERKDRLSMAVGLEVRVPFCDHRLVEYVYNVPWALKSHDGREKSLLRSATAHLLPASVLERRKLPYPSNPDHDYTRAVLAQGAELVAGGDPVLELVDGAWLERAVRRDPTATPGAVRAGVERVLDLSTWLDLHRPRLVLS